MFTGDGHCPAPCTVADAESNLLPVPLHLALPPIPPPDLRQAGLILLCRAASEREGGARVLGARQDCVRVLGAREGGAHVLAQAASLLRVRAMVQSGFSSSRKT